MGVHDISQIYEGLVEEKARGYFKDVVDTLNKSPECVKELQESLCAIIETKSEELESDTTISSEDIERRLGNLIQALRIAIYLTEPNSAALMPALRETAKQNTTDEEVIEKAKSMSIGIDDKNAIYIV